MIKTNFLTLILVFAVASTSVVSPASFQFRFASAFSPTIFSPSMAGFLSTLSNGGITSVKGSWNVSAVLCSLSKPQLVLFGVTISDIATREGIGTGAYCARSNVQPSYYAWNCFCPLNTTGIQHTFAGIKITPGDVVLAIVKYNSTTEAFTAFLKDVTTGKSVKATSPPLPSARRIYVFVGAIEPLATAQRLYPMPGWACCEKFGFTYTDVKATCFVNGLPIGDINASRVDMRDSGYAQIKVITYILNHYSFTLQFQNSGP